MDDDFDSYISLANKSKISTPSSEFNENTYNKTPLPEQQCKYNNNFYRIGEKLEIGCDDTCTCQSNGTMKCQPKCEHPYYRKGRQNTDKLCIVKEIPENPCCTLLVCSSEPGKRSLKNIRVVFERLIVIVGIFLDTTNAALDDCEYKNKTYKYGETFNEECSRICKCEETGQVICKPR